MEQEKLKEDLKNRRVCFFGLGKMGKNMVERLRERNWKIGAYDIEEKALQEVMEKGVLGIRDFSELKEKLRSPRVIWLMVPHKAVDEILFGEKGLVHFLEKGDIVIDGGNSYFRDSVKRGKKLSEKGIEFVDVGVSGGPEGARKGACLMIGGKKEIFEKLKPLFEDLAQEGGIGFFEGIGAGHFVKMVHNGIEYGMMQAIAEGFNLMREIKDYKLDLEKIAEVYSHGSVIESRLIKWLKKGFEEYGQDLKEVSGVVAHTGEGEWTVKTAKELKVPLEVIEASFNFRVNSQKNPSYTGKILMALRAQFGGHKIK